MTDEPKCQKCGTPSTTDICADCWVVGLDEETPSEFGAYEM